MKFNRVELLAKFEAKRDQARAEYDAELAEWDKLRKRYQEEIRSFQFKTIEDLSAKLVQLQAKFADPHYTVTKVDIPTFTVPGNLGGWHGKNGTAQLYDLTVTEADKRASITLNGVEYRKPSSPNLAGLSQLIEVLNTTNDDIVSETSLGNLGFRDTLRRWLSA